MGMATVIQVMPVLVTMDIQATGVTLLRHLPHVLVTWLVLLKSALVKVYVSETMIAPAIMVLWVRAVLWLSVMAFPQRMPQCAVVMALARMDFVNVTTDM